MHSNSEEEGSLRCSSILRTVAVAASIFAGGWWLACQAEGPAAPTAPPAPANRTGAAEAAVGPDSTDLLSGDEALAIWAYEARSTFEARFGPEWTTLARNALEVNLVAGGATEEQAESFRRLVRLVLDADLAAAGSPAAAAGAQHRPCAGSCATHDCPSAVRWRIPRRRLPVPTLRLASTDRTTPATTTMRVSVGTGRGVSDTLRTRWRS